MLKVLRELSSKQNWKVDIVILVVLNMVIVVRILVHSHAEVPLE